MPKKIEILNIKVDNVNMIQAREIVCAYLESDQTGHMIVTPNSEMVVRAQTDNQLAQILNSADLSIPDGAEIVLASRLLSTPRFSERVAGFDLMEELFFVAEKKEYSIFFLGGEPGIAAEAKKRVEQKYSQIDICGYHHGYLDRIVQQNVITRINKLAPDLLLVGMGVPLQERFLYNNLDQLEVKVGMTVGGSFDVLAGKTRRAPLWMQKAYLEWLFRLLKEPSRLSRMVALPRFVFLVMGQVIKEMGGNILND